MDPVTTAALIGVGSKLLPLLAGFFGKGKEPGTRPIDRFTPDQMNLLNSVLGQIGDPLSQGIGHLGNILGGSQQSFDAFAKPYIQDFQQNLVPGIFDQVGQTAGLRSSALGQQLGHAVTNFGTNLASLKEGLKGDAIARLANLGQIGMMPTQQHMMTPGKENFMQLLIPGAIQGASQMGSKIGNYFLQSALEKQKAENQGTTA